MEDHELLAAGERLAAIVEPALRQDIEKLAHQIWCLQLLLHSQLQRLELNPGDVVLIEARDQDAESISAMSEHIRDALPHNLVVFTDELLKVDLIKNAQLLEAWNENRVDEAVALDTSGPSLSETDPRLITLLEEAANEWGAAGVAHTAAQLAAHQDLKIAIEGKDA